MNTSNVEQHLLDLELALLQPSVRKSDRVAELLDMEFVEIGAHGHRSSRDEILALLKEESTTVWTISEFAVQHLSPQIALVSYRAHRHSEPPVHSRRTSVWREVNGQWRMCFHQGTLLATA